jgi:uncharacterized protein
MLHPAVVVRSRGTIESNGLVAAKLIRKETIVWHLTEPTFTWAEVKTWRGKRLRDFKKYGFQCDFNRFSLPTGPSCEMNHSCDPNTWWAGSGILIARRDIFADEEITYDYSTCDINIEFKMSCYCGSPHCRGLVTNHDYLDHEWQNRYSLHLPPHVLTAIKKAR